MNKKNNQIDTNVLLDGQKIKKEDFRNVQEQVAKDPSKKLLETLPGKYKTLNKLHG